MSNIVEETVKAPVKAAGKIGGWAKAAPFIFALLIFVTLVAAIRFREALVAGLARIPGVRWLAGLSAPSDKAPATPSTASNG